MRKKYYQNAMYVFVLIILSANNLIGQQMISYNLQNLPQRNYMNPAFSPKSKIHIGIPLVSGISYNYANSGFQYSDLFRRNETGVLILDLGNSISNMRDKNYLSLSVETDLFAIGIRSGKSYFTFNATEKAELDFRFTKSTMEFLYEGNAGSAGTVKEINPGLEAIHYREYGLAWSRNISKIVTAGVRVKYLYGMEHALTKGNGVSMYTDPVDFTITAKTDYTIYTSGTDNSAFEDFNISNYAFGKKNTGYGADAGIIIKPSSAFEFSASVTDFGYINWNTGNAVYHTATNDTDFVYSGIQLDEFINNDSLDGEAYFQNIGDSLYNTFNITTTHESYKSKLPAKIYVSGSFYISPQYRISAMVRNKTNSHGSTTDYNLSFTGSSKQWLNYSIGINKAAEIPATLGAGFTLNLRSKQIYFASDNVYGLINWKKSSNTGFRAGINLVFGTKTKKPKPPQPNLAEVTPVN